DPLRRRLLLEAADHLVHDRYEVDLLDIERELARRDPRRVEQLADERREPQHLALRLLQAVEHLGPAFVETTALGGVSQAAQNELERRERRLELVRGDGEEIVALGDRVGRVAMARCVLQREADEIGELL